MDKRSFAAGSAMVLVLLFSVASTIAASEGSTDNPGIDLYNGSLQMHGNNLSNADLVDGINLSNPGSNIEISGNQYVVNQGSDSGLDADTLDGNQPSGLTWTNLGVNRSDVSASDVGLGNVENIALSSAGWTDIGIDQSDVSKSDVGLGNVENEQAVAESGDTMEGHLCVTDSSDCGGTESESTITVDSYNSPHSYAAVGDLVLASDNGGFNGGPYTCTVDGGNGDFSCTGSKNWIHDLKNGSSSYYSAQESPQVRAVYEGKASVDGETNITLPSHFSKTVSDKRPSLRATATVQGELAYAAVIEKTDEYIVLDSSEPATANYRITGIREGYEDKEVVRKKE